MYDAQRLSALFRFLRSLRNGHSNRLRRSRATYRHRINLAVQLDRDTRRASIEINERENDAGVVWAGDDGRGFGVRGCTRCRVTYGAYCSTPPMNARPIHTFKQRASLWLPPLTQHALAAQVPPAFISIGRRVWSLPATPSRRRAARSPADGPTGPRASSSTADPTSGRGSLLRRSRHGTKTAPSTRTQCTIMAILPTAPHGALVRPL